MNKERIKKAFDQDVFAQNPFDEALRERTITKVYKSNLKQTSKKRYKFVFHSFLTLCVGFVFVVVGLLFLGNSNDSNNLGESNADKQVVEDMKVKNPEVETKEETKDEKIMLAEQILTNPVALESFMLIPKETQHNFNEARLIEYNQDPDFREKVALGIEKAKYLSEYKLEYLALKIPTNDFGAEFNDYGDKVYIVGEDWKTVEEEFQRLDQDAKQHLSNVLSNIGREYVVSNGELTTPNNQGAFKPSVTWSEVPVNVQERVKQDIEIKVKGLNSLLETMRDTDTLIYEKLRNYHSAYEEITEITTDSFIEYLMENYRLFIFSYLILEPRPTEVLAEPDYLTNEEQVDSALELPR